MQSLSSLRGLKTSLFSWSEQLIKKLFTTLK